MRKELVLVHSRRTSGRRLPGAAPHGTPWSPTQSVQREGVPRATPAKRLHRVMHPARLAACLKPSTVAERVLNSSTETVPTLSDQHQRALRVAPK